LHIFQWFVIHERSLMALGMLFAEKTVYQEASKPLKFWPGCILSLNWYIGTTFLALSFSAVLRASLIKEETPGILKTNDDVIKSGRDIILITFGQDVFNRMQFSEADIDQYMFNKSKQILAFSE
jgi:hypothetical protein